MRFEPQNTVVGDGGVDVLWMDWYVRFALRPWYQWAHPVIRSRYERSKLYRTFLYDRNAYDHLR